jgi:bacterioferritin-associated ferredoxin
LTRSEIETSFQIQMIVCICRVVSDRTVRNVVAAGADSVEKVAMACGAGTGCGACREQVAGIIADCKGSCASATPLCAGTAAARPGTFSGGHSHVETPSSEAA